MLKWFEETDTNDPGILCSRLRLMRNWSEYPFPAKLDEAQSRELVERLEMGLKDIGELDQQKYDCTFIDEMKELDRKVLRERKVIHSAIMKKKTPTGLMLSKREDTGLILGGDDHIRLQLFARGNVLPALWKQANRYDDYINERFTYAFDPKYGFLTAFPTNVGTGLRASVFIHLPALSMGKRFVSAISDMGRFGISVKGLFGEGRDNFGALFEVSNQKTLGQTEREIVELVGKAALQLSKQENEVRLQVLEKHRAEREDEIYKSYGVLQYARRMTQKDALTFLSQILTGENDGLLKFAEPCSIFALMLGVQSANLQRLSKAPMGKEELEGARARYLQERLPKLKEAADGE
ncbi:MAG: ATP--guanido phosphotransferase [Lachnospiraceae bacterium]|jgi:protein arginine kinase|nr:ATP--guanido phosphotransferase [Lachnospiraceae bacterium]